MGFSGFIVLSRTHMVGAYILIWPSF